MSPKFLLLPLVALMVLGPGAASTSMPRAPAPAHPNIVFILTDDLDTEYPEGTWIDHYPRLKALLADQGTTFENFFVSLSLCCPSRSSILRGQYAHNTQIFTNGGAGGGFQKAHDLGLENSTFATWLQDAGYRTVLLGKYLNGYPGNLGKDYVPPGWDEWYSGERNQYLQFNYELNENGTIVEYGDAPEDYLQDVITGKAVDFIERTTEAGRPFMMWMPPYSPHQPATFAPRHAQDFEGVQAPRPPSFNPDDVSGSPSWVQDRPLLADEEIDALDGLYRKRLQSMLGVQDTVDRLIKTLRDTGQLSNTYIFFSSDNGFHLGQHRLAAGKNTEFEEDLHVPLIVRGPGIPAGQVLKHLALNIDFAPTFAQLAGLPFPDFVDGRSLVPLLRPRPVPIEAWRKAFLIEHGFVRTGDVGRTAASASDFEEPPDPFDLIPLQMPSVFQGVHTARHVFVEYLNTGELELYDLVDDPFEVESLADTADPALLDPLAGWLDALRHCAADGCRDAENTPPAAGHRRR